MASKYRIKQRVPREYALKGSLGINSDKGHRVLRWELKPGHWVEVPEEVYRELKRKFDNPKEVDVPDAYPLGDGTYYNAPSGSTRKESPNSNPYVLEFGS